MDIPPQRPRVRSAPLALYDAYDGEHVHVLFARDVVGGDKGQLPIKLELVLVEFRFAWDKMKGDPIWWHVLELEDGREVMARPYAMVRQVHMAPPPDDGDASASRPEDPSVEAPPTLPSRSSPT